MAKAPAGKVKGKSKVKGKKLVATVKLQAPGGQATPAPPIGPALGQHGVNFGQFIAQFNGETKELNGMPVTVVINIYGDRSFDYKVKSPPASVLLKDAAKLAKASGAPGRESAGSVTVEQVRGIAERKLADLNAASVDAAERIIRGTARSMGLEVVS